MRKALEEEAKLIKSIVADARKAAVKTAASGFKNKFENEATDQNDAAVIWLWVTGGLAIATLVLALFAWAWVEFCAKPIQTVPQLIQVFGSKVAILAILFTATLWCGRIYRSLKHQAAINKHRAIGLETFEVFSTGASDNQTKDAVLLETTRSIFSNFQTGYIETKSGGEDQDVRVIEVVKPAVEQAKASPKNTDT